jgi:hypothetical protein
MKVVKENEAHGGFIKKVEGEATSALGVLEVRTNNRIAMSLLASNGLTTVFGIVTFVS